MGTNYYIASNHCGHCNRYDREMHIGKSSGGWCFSLHVGGDCPNSLEEWKPILEKGPIVDEYGTPVTYQEMLSIITEREWGNPTSERTPEWYRRNYANPGPNGLLRHASAHCVSHGEGTWDCITGEFA